MASVATYKEIYKPVTGQALETLPSAKPEEIRPGRTLSILDAGVESEKAETIVAYIHGSMATWRQAAPLLAAIAAKSNVHVVSWDNFGCGESPKPAAGWTEYSSAELVDDAIAILQSRCGAPESRKQSLVLIAHSFGCSLAMQVAQSLKPDAIVLLCPAGVGVSLGAVKNLMLLPVWALNLMQPKLSEGFVQGAIAQSSSDDLRTACREHNARDPMYVCKAYYRQAQECPLEKAQSVLTPLLVVSGEQDQLTPPAAASELVAKLTEARGTTGKPVRHEVIAHASHLLALEQPEELQRLVLDFMTVMTSDFMRDKRA